MIPFWDSPLTSDHISISPQGLGSNDVLHEKHWFILNYTKSSSRDPPICNLATVYKSRMVSLKGRLLGIQVLYKNEGFDYKFSNNLFSFSEGITWIPNK